MKNSEKNLICIECCHKIDSLFKTYQDGFKDINECVSFSKIISTSSVFLGLIFFTKSS